MANSNKTTKKKKKVVISHITKPEKMTLEEWPVKLRKQVVETEHFGIRCVDDSLCPGATSIKIPVESKETVTNLFNLLGKLFAK